MKGIKFKKKKSPQKPGTSCPSSGVQCSATHDIDSDSDQPPLAPHRNPQHRVRKVARGSCGNEQYSSTEVSYLLVLITCFDIMYVMCTMGGIVSPPFHIIDPFSPGEHAFHGKVWK